MRIALAMILTFASLLASGQLTSEEKSLLTSSISADMAKEMGKAGDAAGLARIIAVGDPELVRNFSMAMSRAEPLPHAIESQILMHFSDPRVGPGLRAMAIRYQTHALFDRFYAMAQATYQNRDQVFELILRTDQPGIEDAILRLSPRFPVRSQSLNPALDFLGKRKYPGAIDPILAALESTDWGDNYDSTLSLLIHYDSPDVWRKASDAIERMNRDGHMTDRAYKQARSKLDTALKDPQAQIARNRAEENMAAYYRRQSDLNQLATDASRVHSDPPRYVEAQLKYVAALDAFASGLDDPRVTSMVAGEYTRLGMVALLRANDPKAAATFFEKSARSYDVLGTVALADTLEQGLDDKPAAIRAYQSALTAANDARGQIQPYAPPFGSAGDPMNEFWRAWFSAEIEYLQTGKPFHGRVSEPAITGFWSLVQMSRSSVVSYSRMLNEASPARATVTTAKPAPSPSPAPASGAAQHFFVAINAYDDSIFRADWPKVTEKYWNAAAPDQADWLAKFPASRMSLLVSMREVSAINDPSAILSQLARDDPSGFWTAIILGTVDYHESHGRDGALEDGVANYLPGMAGPDQPNPLAVAARRFMQSRGLKVAEKK